MDSRAQEPCARSRQPLKDRPWHLPARLGSRIWHLDNRLAFGIERLVLGPVVEGEAFDIINERFRRRVLGEDQRVFVQLDVIVSECLRGIGLSDD